MAKATIIFDTGYRTGIADRVQIDAETETGNNETTVHVTASNPYRSAETITMCIAPGTARKLATFFSSLADLEEA